MISMVSIAVGSVEDWRKESDGQRVMCCPMPSKEDKSKGLVEDVVDGRMEMACGDNSIFSSSGDVKS